MPSHKTHYNAAASHFELRRASIADVDSIFSLMAGYAEKGLLLPVKKKALLERLNSFMVAETKLDERIVGCVALRDFGDGLFEVRSLAVEASMNGKGVGSSLVANLPNEFTIPEGSTLFALTYRPSFFRRLGFELVDKSLFPAKIWSDCDNCPKKDHCDEQAVRAVVPLPNYDGLISRN